MSRSVETDKNEFIEKCIWKADYAQLLTESMQSDEAKEQLSVASSVIDVDINKALEAFNDCLKQKAESMKRKKIDQRS